MKAADGAAAAGLSSDHIASGGSLSGAKSGQRHRCPCHLNKEPLVMFAEKNNETRKNATVPF